MFNEREMSKAIDWLFELFSPEDYEGYDEDEIGYAGGLCLPEVCTALRGAAQTVYQYSVAGGYEKCFNYRGMELFDQPTTIPSTFWTPRTLPASSLALRRNVKFSRNRLRQ